MSGKQPLLAEFRRFTNALKNKPKEGKWWTFTADTGAGILVVAVNEERQPEKAYQLRKLVGEWGGVIHGH